MLGLPTLWWLVIAGAVGAAIGSFLNVVIIRTHDGHGFWQGNSSCPNCHHPIRWYDLVPVVSYFALRGRCRDCRQPISRQYPVTEILTIILFVLVAWRLTSPVMFLGWLIAGLMVLVAVYDWRWATIPDVFSVPLIVAGLVYSWVTGANVVLIGLGMLGGVGFFALQYLLSRKRWVGSGDIVLGAGLGALLGGRMVWLSLMIAYMVGALVAGGWILSKKLNAKSTIPFGPYLMLGGFVAWLWGEQLVHWYVNRL